MTSRIRKHGDIKAITTAVVKLRVVNAGFNPKTGKFMPEARSAEGINFPVLGLNPAYTPRSLSTKVVIAIVIQSVYQNK